jgi:hypothetical protein
LQRTPSSPQCVAHVARLGISIPQLVGVGVRNLVSHVTARIHRTSMESWPGDDPVTVRLIVCSKPKHDQGPDTQQLAAVKQWTIASVGKLHLPLAMT